MSQAIAVPPSGAFDYAALPEAVALDARNVAERFRAFEAQTVAAMLALGADLLRVKSSVDHGQFGAWLAAEFGQSARSAQRYMVAAERLADKSDTVSYLPVSTIHKLAAPSTPQPARAEIVSKIEAGERLGPVAIDGMIAKAKTEARAEVSGHKPPAARGPKAKAAPAEIRRALEAGRAELVRLRSRYVGQDADHILRDAARMLGISKYLSLINEPALISPDVLKVYRKLAALTANWRETGERYAAATQRWHMAQMPGAPISPDELDAAYSECAAASRVREKAHKAVERPRIALAHLVFAHDFCAGVDLNCGCGPGGAPKGAARYWPDKAGEPAPDWQAVYRRAVKLPEGAEPTPAAANVTFHGEPGR